MKTLEVEVEALWEPEQLTLEKVYYLNSVFTVILKKLTVTSSDDAGPLKVTSPLSSPNIWVWPQVLFHSEIERGTRFHWKHFQQY